MAGHPGGSMSPTQGLLYELAAILSSLMLGILAVRLQIVKPERGDMRAMGFMTGNIGLPLLVFRAVATARLEGIDLGVALACGLGKALMMAFVWGVTYCGFEHKVTSKRTRFLTATVFAHVVVSTNDFALGFPVIQALYGDHMTAYIATNAVVGSGLFTPFVSVLLAVGSNMPDDSGDENAGAEQTESVRQHGSCRRCANFIWLLRIIRGALMNIIIASAVLGLLYKLAFSWTLVDTGRAYKLPPILDTVVGLFTSPFGMCALFMCGTNVRSVTISIWPLFLVVCKVVVCAFISFRLSTMLVQHNAEYMDNTNFSFFYGTIPTSASPIILGSKFAPSSTELVATAILSGTFFAGIIMYIFAVNVMVPPDVSMIPMLAELQHHVSVLSVASIAAVVAGVLILTLKGSWGWSRPGKQILAAMCASVTAYQSAMLVFDRLVRHSGASLCEWNSLLIVVAFFQNCCRLLVLCFPVLMVRWGPPRLGSADTPGRAGLVLTALALAGSGVFCRLVNPNAVHEVCRAAAEARGESMVAVEIWPVVLVDHALFWTTLGAIIALTWRHRDRPAGRQPSEGKGAEAAKEVAEPGACDAEEEEDPAREVDTMEEWLETPPRRLFRMLILAQALRTLTQVVNASQVLANREIKGGFVTLLILEYFLEHGQGFILLVGFALDSCFMNALAKAIGGSLPWPAWLSRCYAISWRGDAEPHGRPAAFLVGGTMEFTEENQETVAAVLARAESEHALRRRLSRVGSGLRTASELGGPEGAVLPRASTQKSRGLRTVSELAGGEENNICPTASGLGAGSHRE